MITFILFYTILSAKQHNSSNFLCSFNAYVWKVLLFVHMKKMSNVYYDNGALNQNEHSGKKVETNGIMITLIF